MLNANGAIHREIAEVLDNEFLTQQMKNNAFDLHKTTSYIASKMLQLCAPVRDAEIRSIETSKSLGVALVSILDILQSMKLDMANFRLESIKPYLKNEAVNFERNKFKAALEKGSISLEKTILWLGSSVNSIKETADQRNPEQLESLDLNIKFSRVLDQAFLGLFFAPTALEPASLAETLIGDVKRLFGFQNEFQGIAITAAVAHLAQNLVPAFKNQSQAMKELTKKMFDLLQGPSTSLATISNLIIEMANELMHHQGRVKANLSNLTSSPVQQQLCELSAEKVQLVRSMVDKTLSLKDPFLSVILRRIEKITRLYLQDDSKKLSYASNGLLLVQSELENLLERIGILVKHNRNVFAHYYDNIISQLLTQ